MFNKLKQFQDLRSRAKQIQTTLEKETVEGSSGWGKVKINMNGNQRVTNVVLTDDALADKANLQNLIKDAFNDAAEKLQKLLSGKLKDIGGLDLAKDIQEMTNKQ
ncbi:MAG: YbaB/EbfC family nucleoid-associated protein [Patescibacteria group bacterium]|nr:YbaB/EbfC family nucleoid-associated protein [Patescibacteria group bacterium]